MATTEKKPRRLVIVESPTKARTIVGYLGDGYDVEASVGHIRDLPTPSELPADMKKGPYGKFAVDVDNGFDPYYRVDPGKKKKVTELKRLLKDADELYLATDEDREGEAIAWHLLEVLKPKIPVKRMVFHEITPEAIARALENTREIDIDLVDAQETRRVLDRLYGYEVSPVLWRKIRAGLSAGRVQSVATRLVVERERERMAFVSADYWDLDIDLGLPDGSNPFAANLTTLDGSRVASGRDFDDKGQLKTKSAVVVDQARAEELATLLSGPAKNALTVTAVESKPYSRRPAAPFTTSTMQQEAGRKLRMSARQAMRTAQSLYEHGYITYMRTDSSALSGQAISAARRQVTELYGPEFVPEAPRQYSGKQKSAQEAHEAIRPAGDSFRTPAQVAKSLNGDEFRLYDLIWKRTVASQMADAKGKTATIRVGADLGDGHEAGFSASAPSSPSAASSPPTRRVRTRAGTTRSPANPACRRSRRARSSPSSPSKPTVTPRTASALHRGEPGQAARGARHRPSLDVRFDHLRHPGPRLRHLTRECARAQLARVLRRPPPRGALHGARRLRVHRRPRIRARPDRDGRGGPQGLARTLLLRRRGLRPGRAQGDRRRPRRHRRP